MILYKKALFLFFGLSQLKLNPRYRWQLFILKSARLSLAPYASFFYTYTRSLSQCLDITLQSVTFFLIFLYLWSAFMSTQFIKSSVANLYNFYLLENFTIVKLPEFYDLRKRARKINLSRSFGAREKKNSFFYISFKQKRRVICRYCRVRRFFPYSRAHFTSARTYFR